MFGVEKSISDRWYRPCLWVCTLLAYCSEHVKGVVEMSPSAVAPVCQAGDQLELRCTTSGLLQVWQLTVICESGVAMTHMRTVTSAGPSGLADSRPLTINSTTVFTFSRLSTRNSLPLISEMTISSVSEGLNGVAVNCTDEVTSESATTTIHIIGDVQTSRLSIQLQSEQFSSDRVLVILEWTTSNLLNQYPQLLQNVSVDVVPDFEVEMMFIGNTSVQLTLLYNMLYNVNIIQPAACEQLSQAVSIELNYSKCSIPMTHADNNVIIEGYEDPVLEGEVITFSCRNGLALIGPDSATCMGNGEWEPDPRSVNCTGTPTNMSGTDAGSASHDSLVFGTVFGVLTTVILLATIAAITVILKRKGVCKYHKRTPDHADTSDGYETHVYSQLDHGHNFKANHRLQNECRIAQTEETQNLNYTEVQLLPLKLSSHRDDNHVEYTKLHHNTNEDKVSVTQIEEDNYPPVNLDNLLVQLRPQVGPKWYQFGEAARIQNETLDKLAEQCSSEECIVELFDYWLMNSVEIPTWRDIAKILKKIGLTELGVNIERVYTTGTLPIVVDMNFVPKLDTEEENELPPPLPPRELSPPLLSKEPPAPALPPKPVKQVGV